jgi:hypothetical protein
LSCEGNRLKDFQVLGGSQHNHVLGPGSRKVSTFNKTRIWVILSLKMVLEETHRYIWFESEI